MNAETEVWTVAETIGKYLEQEGKRGNVEAVEKGMDFMIAKGFVDKKDKEFALNMVRKIRERGKELNFDECEMNPESCEKFMPEEERSKFNAMKEARNILAEEMRKVGAPFRKP